MATAVDSETRTDRRDGRVFPAYGPVDAALGYALFYVVVERATPAVVEVFGDALPDVSPSAVRFALAAALWFVLAVTVLDQLRRQLAALGIVGDDSAGRRAWDRYVPSASRTIVHFGLLVVGGVVAAATFESGVDAAVSLVRVVGTLDPGAFVLGEFLEMVVFFVAFGVATHAMDRLLVDGVRSLLAA